MAIGCSVLVIFVSSYFLYSVIGLLGRIDALRQQFITFPSAFCGCLGHRVSANGTTLSLYEEYSQDHSHICLHLKQIWKNVNASVNTWIYGLVYRSWAVTSGPGSASLTADSFLVFLKKEKVSIIILTRTWPGSRLIGIWHEIKNLRLG